MQKQKQKNCANDLHVSNGRQPMSHSLMCSSILKYIYIYIQRERELLNYDKYNINNNVIIIVIVIIITVILLLYFIAINNNVIIVIIIVVVIVIIIIITVMLLLYFIANIFIRNKNVFLKIEATVAATNVLFNYGV